MGDPRATGLPELPARPAEAHKGSMGRVLLVAGSRGMAGAAGLAALSALRGGAGYVVACAPGGIATELTLLAPSAVLHLCGEADRGDLGAPDLGGILDRLPACDALAVGPGLGRSAGTGELVLGLLKCAPVSAGAVPLVLDADALNLLAGVGRLGPGRALAPRAILTPHPGEAARLLGWDGAAAVQRDRARALAELVDRSGAVVLLKGAGTLVGAPGREAWLNPSGNPGMATAGSGDVLTGLLAALLARGIEDYDAARLAAWLHGRAGDHAAAARGEEALIAPDLAEHLSDALREHPRAS